MTQKILVRQLITAGLIIICFSFIFLMLKADPTVRGDADAGKFGEMIVVLYLVFVSLPIGYALTIYFTYYKRTYSSLIKWFWGFLLIVHLILQFLFFFRSSPLHWLAALASVYLLINHFVYVK